MTTPTSVPSPTAPVPPPPLRAKRHTIRGVIAGLLLGLGLAVLLLVYGKAPFGIATPYVCLGCGLVAGIALGVSGPTRTR